MKLFFKMFLCLSIIISSVLSVGCNNNNDAMIKDAVELITEYWEEQYSEDDIGDWYFEIKNTRVIHIKENDIEQFKDVEYIIEFDIYTDWFGTAPYYSNVFINSDVVINKDGSMKVESRVMNTYRNKTFDTDFSDFIEEIIDYKDKYNCIKDLEE